MKRQYHRFIFQISRGNDDTVALDWHCSEDQILMEGYYDRKIDRISDGSGFDMLVLDDPPPIYEELDRYELEYITEDLSAAGYEDFQFRILIETMEFKKNIRGNSFNVPCEQVAMLMILQTPDWFKDNALQIGGFTE